MSNVSTSDVFLMRSTEAAPLRKNWGWTIGYGVLLALAGIIALGSVLTATIASVLFVGVAMIACGFIEIVYGIAMRSWKNFFLWVLLGVLYVIGGFAVFENPLLAAGFLTLMLGAGLIAAELAGAASKMPLGSIEGLAVVGNAAHRNSLLVKALEKQFDLPCRVIASGGEAALGVARLAAQLNPAKHSCM